MLLQTIQNEIELEIDNHKKIIESLKLASAITKYDVLECKGIIISR